MFENAPVKHEYKDDLFAQLDYFTCAENLKELACNNCGRTTIFEDLFDRHICRLSKASSRYFCYKCHNFFSYSLLVMMTHINKKCKTKKAKSKLGKSMRSKTGNPPKPQCPYCQHTSKTNSHLKAHVRSKHTTLTESEYFKCGHCSYKTIYSFVLKRHVTTVHKGIRPEKKERWFSCEHCSYKTKYNRDLNRHNIFNHVPSEHVQWFECDKCFYKTKWKGDLQQHVRMQHAAPEDIVWFQCDFCDYREKRKGNLKRHVEHRHRKAQLFEFVDVCLA